MTLSLLSTIAQIGQGFQSPVMGRTIGGTLALTINPGGRWRLESSLLFASDVRDGDTPVITETVGGVDTPYPFYFRLQGGVQIIAPLPDPIVGAAYDARPIVQGGVGVLRFFVATGSLPLGLKLNSASGRVYGDPVSASAFTIGVTDASGSVVQICVGSTPANALLSPIDGRVLLSPVDGRILLRAA